MRIRWTWLALIVLTLGAGLGKQAFAIAAELDIKVLEKRIERGTSYLKTQQADGGWFGGYPTVGQTALAVTAMADGHLKLRADDPAVNRAVRFVLSNIQSDGGIYSPKIGLGNYNTSIAILMLVALENPKHRRTIDRATQYVTGIQKKADPSEDSGSGGWGYDPERKKKADMSNTNWALEAIAAAKQVGVEVDPRVHERALVFLKRCQNDPEVNDLAYAAANPDGGAIYRPDDSKAGKVIIRGRQGWRSYGSMTYAMLKGYVYADLKKDDPAVAATWRWISNNYTLAENPGMRDAGLYYYYVTFAKALAAYGRRTVTDEFGEEHDWAVELGQMLIEKQRKDGSWVNANPRWYESDSVLVTSYALMALNVVHEQLAARERKADDK